MIWTLTLVLLWTPTAPSLSIVYLKSETPFASQAQCEAAAAFIRDAESGPWTLSIAECVTNAA